MSRNISTGISGDIAQIQEAFARLRKVIPEQPFTEGVVGIDMGSGEDATAIAASFWEEHQRTWLSDRITPLPPRLEETRQEDQRRSARIWAQYGGMPYILALNPVLPHESLTEPVENAN